MRILSGLTRIVAGLGVMGMALFVYSANQEQMDGRAEVVLDFFGQQITTTPGQMHLALVTAATVGALMVVLGVVTLVRKPKPAPAAPESAPAP